MVGYIVDVMLGQVGRAILHFYQAHALVISLLLLAYGMTMYTSWMTLLRIHRYLVVEVAKGIHLHAQLNRKSTVKQVRDKVGVPWEAAVKAAPFPLIGRMAALIPRRKTLANVQDLLDEKEIIEQAFDLLGGVKIRRIMPSYKRMVSKEVSQIDRNMR
jgi:hypothetical protein